MCNRAVETAQKRHENRTKWFRARKKPVEVLVREVKPEVDIFIGKHQVKGELIRTKEGRLTAVSGRDFIIKGVDGELYPISKEIFYKTYEILGEAK
ncbi:MAG: hypothetical protein QXR76_03395 [Candidatus Bathyarchaeia archaeon]